MAVLNTKDTTWSFWLKSDETLKVELSCIEGSEFTIDRGEYDIEEIEYLGKDVNCPSKRKGTVPKFGDFDLSPFDFDNSSAANLGKLKAIVDIAHKSSSEILVIKIDGNDGGETTNTTWTIEGFATKAPIILTSDKSIKIQATVSQTVAPVETIKD